MDQNTLPVAVEKRTESLVECNASENEARDQGSRFIIIMHSDEEVYPLQF
jgi:hypothetical protein